MEKGRHGDIERYAPSEVLALIWQRDQVCENGFLTPQEVALAETALGGQASAMRRATRTTVKWNSWRAGEHRFP